jgi:hypothetical protein
MIQKKPQHNLDVYLLLKRHNTPSRGIPLGGQTCNRSNRARGVGISPKKKSAPCTYTKELVHGVNLPTETQLSLSRI